MLDSHETWLALTDEFHAAAIDNSRWQRALEALASATGSRSGQLLGLGASAVVPFNIVTNFDQAAIRAFSESGRGDARINPRIKVGTESAVLCVNTEADFLTREEHERHPHYEEFARPWDIPFSCFTLLERREELSIGLSVLRSNREGPIAPAQRDIFAAVAPHVRAAVRTQLALESHGAALLTGCMDALSIPLFICDGLGRVRALTPSAETLVRGTSGLQLKGGQLSTVDADSAVKLEAAIAVAAAGPHRSGVESSASVVVRAPQNGGTSLVLDVVYLPSLQYEFSFAPRVLITVRQPRKSDDRRGRILRAAFDLTSAETEIALHLSQGKTAESIAAARDVAIGTVRAQIKSLLSKVGANRQVELVARLNQF